MAACRSFQRALELDHKNAQAQQEVGLICSASMRGGSVLGLEKIVVTNMAGLIVPLHQSLGLSYPNSETYRIFSL